MKPAGRVGPGRSPAIAVAGDWLVRVGAGELAAGAGTIVLEAPVTIPVPPAVVVAVTDERHARVPLFNAKAAGWTKGIRLAGVTTQETTAKGALDPASLILTSADDKRSVFALDKDFALDPEWGTFGRLPGGRIGEEQPVVASYRHGLGRLDGIVARKHGPVALRAGVPHISVPRPPAVAADEAVLATVWVPPRLAALSADNLFPVTEAAYPEPPPPAGGAAEQWLPATLRKLRQGVPLRILAWGDSVTEASYIPAAERWQAQFVDRLRGRFPGAAIDLVSLGWGGRNTGSFLSEPPGSPYNYREKVLGARPDLIVSEFCNDARLTPDEVEARYGRFLADFQEIGAEWIILTPHYVRPDWMGLTREREIDEDPRPYVAGLRRFASRHPVALADAALRWGRLWRQGIPYTTLLLNAINHPDGRGMRIFADSLMALFP